MTRSVPEQHFGLIPLRIIRRPAKLCCYVAALSITGCTSSQVRYDATRMREDVMVYYNDQIMDNLIKAKKKEPFVHVDIQSLSSQGSSLITGTIGDGETTTNSGGRQVSSNPVGLVSSLTHIVTRPFAYSISPQRSETLTLTTIPALGPQAAVPPLPPSGSPTPPTPQLTKYTEVRGAPPNPNEKGPLEKTITEAAPNPPKPKPRTIYDLYEEFAEKHLSEAAPGERPDKQIAVPGTLKRSGATYYYINRFNDGKAYYKFCKALFTKGGQGGGGSGSLEKDVQAAQAEIEVLKGQVATPSLR